MKEVHETPWANHGSTSSISTTSSDHPPTLNDSSTRCNEFQWHSSSKMKTTPSTKPPIGRTKKSAPGSLDRRRHTANRHDRDQKSRSTHVPKSPPKLDDFSPCQNWCCNPHDNFFYENFHRRHERIDPHRYGSSPMLMGGSHQDIYGDCGGRYRHEMMGCCGYHIPNPCCYYGERGGHWMPPSSPYPKVFGAKECHKECTNSTNIQD